MAMSYSSNITRRNFLETLGRGAIGFALGASIVYADGLTENKYILDSLNEIHESMEKTGKKELIIQGVHLNADDKPDVVKINRGPKYRTALGNYDTQVDVLEIRFEIQDGGSPRVSAEVSGGKLKDVYLHSAVDGNITECLKALRASGKFPTK